MKDTLLNIIMKLQAQHDAFISDLCNHPEKLNENKPVIQEQVKELQCLRKLLSIL